MAQPDSLAERFEEHRGRLTAVAYRMLGSWTEAEDAVQDAWLRLGRADAGAVDNLGAWLTTVVSRVCLNVLQSRRAHPEVPLVPNLDEPAEAAASGVDPEREALLADSVGMALQIVLDLLTPAERVAFVLHDLFGLPFDDIAPIVGRSPAATRQLASRARRRVQGADADPEVDRRRQQAVVAAFLAATRKGDFGALLAMLDPDVVLRADETAVRLGAPARSRGAEAVAGFLQRARGARLMLIDGVPGAVWMPGGRPRVALRFTIAGGRIAEVEAVGDPERLSALELTPRER